MLPIVTTTNYLLFNTPSSLIQKLILHHHIASFMKSFSLTLPFLTIFWSSLAPLLFHPPPSFLGHSGLSDLFCSLLQIWPWYLPLSLFVTFLTLQCFLYSPPSCLTFQLSFIPISLVFFSFNRCLLWFLSPHALTLRSLPSFCSLSCRGVVRVDVNLQDVDINQCSASGWFAGTHRCNLTSMEVSWKMETWQPLIFFSLKMKLMHIRMILHRQ